MARKKEPGAETERKPRKKSRPEAGRVIDGEYWYIDPSRVKPELEIREAALRYPEEGEKDLNRGHRSRVRERFRAEEGFDSFQDHEILELLLTYGSPRKDSWAPSVPPRIGCTRGSTPFTVKARFARSRISGYCSTISFMFR